MKQLSTKSRISPELKTFLLSLMILSKVNFVPMVSANMICTRLKWFSFSVEDSNFALFNFVNEQNNEIERLQDSIDEVNVILCSYFGVVFS